MGLIVDGLVVFLTSAEDAPPTSFARTRSLWCTSKHAGTSRDTCQEHYDILHLLVCFFVGVKP